MLKESKYNIYKGLEIYNSISKSIIEIENSEFIQKLIRKYNNHTCDAKEIENIKILKENGFIVDDSLDEKQLIDYFFYKRYFASDFQEIILMPTLGCNFICPYCFEKNKIDDFKFNNKYFEALYNYSKAKMKQVKKIHFSLFGGEPLLLKEPLYSCLYKIKKEAFNEKVNFSISITTNGSLIDESDILHLEQLNCRSIQITFDGSIKSHDSSRIFKNGNKSFELLMKNINMLANNKGRIKNTKIVLRINILNNSLKEVEELLENVNKENRKYIHLLVRNVFNTDNFSEVNNSTANDLQNIQKEVLKMGFSMLNTATPFIYCEADSDTNTFHLLPDLSIWKCCSDLEDFDSCIGQMKDDGTIKFDAEKLIKWYNACNFNSNSHCIQCKNLPDCLGGCPKYNQKHGKRRCDKEYMLNYRYMGSGR